MSVGGDQEQMRQAFFALCAGVDRVAGNLERLNGNVERVLHVLGQQPVTPTPPGQGLEGLAASFGAFADAADKWQQAFSGDRRRGRQR